MHTSIVTSILGGVAGLLMSVSAPAAGTLKIGVIEPLSGPVAAIGRDTLNGFKSSSRFPDRWRRSDATP